MEPATPTPSNGQPAAQPTAQLVQPDPVTADLLKRHNAGEQLTQAEFGKLGGWTAKLNRLFKGKADRGAAQVEAANQTPADSQIAPPVDADLVKRTTAALLKTTDTVVRRYVTREARKAGAEDRTVARFDSAVALPADSKELLVETSPEVIAALGVDPRHYPLTVAISVLGMHASNIWLAVDELKAMQKKNAQADEPQDREPTTT